MPPEAARPSLYRLTQPLLRRLLDDAAALRLGVETTAEGCTLVDAGIDCAGGIAAGLRIAEICLGGLGSVQLAGAGPFRRWPWSLSVHAAHPVLACLGSQLAGWQLTVGSGKDSLLRPRIWTRPRGRAQGSAVRRTRLSRCRRRRLPGARSREAAAAGVDRKGVEGLRPARPASSR